jgi:hypothetical protein
VIVGSFHVNGVVTRNVVTLCLSVPCYDPSQIPLDYQVILSPSAVMADGGAIFGSGHLMVAIAAKVRPTPTPTTFLPCVNLLRRDNLDAYTYA